MTDTLITLADRCEAATGSDVALDAAIEALLRNQAPKDWANRDGGEWQPSSIGAISLTQEDGATYPVFMAREYTASIDAALALVPEGWWLQSLSEYNQRTWEATLRSPIYETEPRRVYVYSRTEGNSHGVQTPALALCAACLRARAVDPSAQRK